MDRVYNFAAGPAAMPLEALQTAAREMCCYGSTGMSVMEMSHRSKMYLPIYQETVSLVRELMHVPDNYSILLLQGGATQQFAAIPMNLMTKSGPAPTTSTAATSPTAQWSRPVSTARRAAWPPRARKTTSACPAWDEKTFDPEADYCLHHHQQHHLRHALFRLARNRQCAAGGRYVLQHPLRKIRREPLRRDLCRRTEEHRPGGL